MGGGSHLLKVYNSSHAYQMKRLTASIPTSINMRYSSEGKKFHSGDGEDEEEKHQIREERAPSTAQEFMKVAAEKNMGEDSTTANNPDHQKQKARDDNDDDDADQQTTTSTSDSDEEEKVDDLLPAAGNIGPTS